MKASTLIRKLINRAGYDVARYQTGQMGRRPLEDVQRFLPAKKELLVFDAGGNTGQSVLEFKQQFPTSTIHSFEPSPTTFQKLKQNIAAKSGVTAWNYALGSKVGKQNFSENSNPDMSSFFKLSEFGWGKEEKQTLVEVMTVDQFCADHQITSIDLLKSDTQGYDLEVFKGAEKMMQENRIGLVYFEVIFSDMYKGLPTFDETFRYLIDRNFLLISIYPSHYQRNLASWTDVLFINKEYYQRVMK
ncbi:MAG: noeI [Pedosphaera sp.]|nr:noeI [Pedosphaera sp.]